MEKKPDKKRRLTEAQKADLLAEYERKLKDSGGMSSIKETALNNPELEAILKKDRNRFIRGCG